MDAAGFACSWGRACACACGQATRGALRARPLPCGSPLRAERRRSGAWLGPCAWHLSPPAAALRHARADARRRRGAARAMNAIRRPWLAAAVREALAAAMHRTHKAARDRPAAAAAPLVQIIGVADGGRTLVVSDTAHAAVAVVDDPAVREVLRRHPLLAADGGSGGGTGQCAGRACLRPRSCVIACQRPRRRGLALASAHTLISFAHTLPALTRICWLAGGEPPLFGTAAIGALLSLQAFDVETVWALGSSGIELRVRRLSYVACAGCARWGAPRAVDALADVRAALATLRSGGRASDGGDSDGGCAADDGNGDTRTLVGADGLGSAPFLPSLATATTLASGVRATRALENAGPCAHASVRARASSDDHEGIGGGDALAALAMELSESDQGDADADSDADADAFANSADGRDASPASPARSDGTLDTQQVGCSAGGDAAAEGEAFCDALKGICRSPERPPRRSLLPMCTGVAASDRAGTERRLSPSATATQPSLLDTQPADAGPARPHARQAAAASCDAAASVDRVSDSDSEPREGRRAGKRRRLRASRGDCLRA